jgi:hypothetical protein
MGSDLGWQMFKALGMTGLLGISFPRYIDNWGHAGGALVGFPLGFLHRWFMAHREEPKVWGLGVMMSLAIAGCGLAQLAADRREDRLLHDFRSLVERKAYDTANRGLPVVALLGEAVVSPGLVVQSLQKVADILDQPPTKFEYRRALTLCSTAQVRALAKEEQAEFDRILGRISTHLVSAMAYVLDKGTTRVGFRRVKSLAEISKGRPLMEIERVELKQSLGLIRQEIQREQGIRVRELWRQRRPGSAPRDR